MKKGFVLVSLFVLPIVVYLFFATGVNNFISLPTITKNIPDIIALQQKNDSIVQLQDKITIIVLPGHTMKKKNVNLLN